MATAVHSNTINTEIVWDTVHVEEDLLDHKQAALWKYNFWNKTREACTMLETRLNVPFQRCAKKLFLPKLPSTELI